MFKYYLRQGFSFFFPVVTDPGLLFVKCLDVSLDPCSVNVCVKAG